MSDIKGLTSKEVSERIDKGLVNREKKYVSKTYKKIIYENIFTFFNLIFLLIAILLIIARDFKSLTFIPLLLINLSIGIVQEIKSKKLIDKLTLLNECEIDTYRDNNIVKVKSSDLVKDDVVIFKSGNQIVADARVVEGRAYLNESLLTGESLSVEKNVFDTLYSGSFVTQGEITCVLTNVGEESYISKLTKKAKESKDTKESEIKSSLNKLLAIISIIIVPLALFLIFGALNRGEGFSKSISSMAGSILMMIPEGLFLLSSVSLALSAYRLAKENVLIQSMDSIETLARVNVLCLDKTGTITTNKLNVSSFKPVGISKDELFDEISAFACYQDADNKTMEAIKSYFNNDSSYKFISKTSFSSELKYSSCSFSNHSIVVGALEFVFKSDYLKYKDEADKYALEGYRVLAVARTPHLIKDREELSDLTLLGFILLEDSIRENAIETFKYFEAQGVDIKVISGDSALTVSSVAKRAQIKNADRYIDASDLNLDDLDNEVLKYTVFGRVTPEIKQKLVIALKNNNKKVAMTGDGVNDVLALKEANLSVAMREGADAAVKVAQVVLLDSDFSHMPSIVFEGRKVVNNLERSGSLFITKNIFSILLTIFCIFLNLSFPIKPTQTSLINTFVIGLPAFLLSLQSSNKLIKGSFVSNILKCAIPSGLVEALMIIIFMLVGLNNGISDIEVSSLSTILMGVIGSVVIFNIARPYSKYKLIVCVLCLVGFALNVLLALKVSFFTHYYVFSEISFNGAKLALIFVPISILSYVLLYTLFDKLNLKNYLIKIYQKIKNVIKK